jgi:hypothetical protein
VSVNAHLLEITVFVFIVHTPYLTDTVPTECVLEAELKIRNLSSSRFMETS